MLVKLTVNHNKLEIASFLNLAKSFVFKIRNKLVVFGEDVSSETMWNTRSKGGKNISNYDLI